MKILLALLAITVSSFAFSQEINKPEPVGFWVVENNVKSPKESTVFFYNQDHVLVYKETVSGKKLNVSRKKTIKQLNAVLLQSVLVYEKEQVQRQNLHLVWNKR